MRGWLANARQALALAAERADLWPAGTLAWLGFLGWLPLVVAFAPPSADGVERFGVSLYLSSAFPWNVVALAAASVVAFAVLCLLAGACDVALDRQASGDAGPGIERASLRAFAIVLLCSLPVVALTGLALLAAVAVAPGEYLSGDIGTPVLLRILGHVGPQLAALAGTLLVVQTIAALALRSPGSNALRALGAGVVELVRHPARRLATAACVLALDLAVLAVQVALLRVLWAPIAAALGDGRLASPETVLLLVGFVAIWLGLLLAAGALRVAASTWWALELGAAVTPDGTGKPLRPPLATRPPLS